MPTPRRPDRIDPGLEERVLDKLGFSNSPATDSDGLAQVYEAWCRNVPFDNIRKLVHLHESIPGPLPGDDATDFLSAWLEHGTGGTCWAGNGALQALLASLGFPARRGVGTMLVREHTPPNHGTVVVTLEGRELLVDASILSREPLPLHPGSRIDDPAWGVHVHEKDGKLRIAWRPFHAETFDCRIESLDASREEFRERHEASREWGPFNFALSARLLAGDAVIGASFGLRSEIDAEGKLTTAPFSGNERVAFLVERLGISEELATLLPPDQPMPPPPESL